MVESGSSCFHRKHTPSAHTRMEITGRGHPVSCWNGALHALIKEFSALTPLMPAISLILVPYLAFPRAHFLICPSGMAQYNCEGQAG